RKEEDIGIRSGGENLTDGAIDRLEHPQHGIASNRPLPSMQRMILAQMPQEVPRRMRLAEHREEQVPRLPAQKIQADRGSSRDALPKRPFQPGDGNGVPVTRMVPIECGMASV